MSGEEDVDVEALLASINANFEADDTIVPVEQTKQEEVSPTPVIQPDQIIVIREEAEQSEREFDPIIDIMNRIDLQNSLLTDKIIQEHQLDTSSLQQICTLIKYNFDIKSDVIVKNQRIIISKTLEVRNLTTKLLGLQQAKDYTFSKAKSSDIQQRAKDLKSLELQVSKTKGYVMNMIERLEMVEYNLDKIIEYHVKRKLDQMEDKAKHNII